MKTIEINSNRINLGQFLKWADLVNTGGEAKNIIQEGKVKVNQEIEIRRSKTLKPGDIIEYDGNKYKVVTS